MDPPVTTERLSQIERAITQVDNAKLQLEQTLAAFWEHMPPVDPEIILQRMNELRARIRSLEERRRALLRERELLLIRAAPSISGRPGGNN